MFYHNPGGCALEQARQELDLTQRIALYREVERIVMDDARGSRSTTMCFNTSINPMSRDGSQPLGRLGRADEAELVRE